MRIAVHAFDGIPTFHLAAPLLVFGELSRLGVADDWETTVWTEDGLPVRTAEGALIDSVADATAVSRSDLVVFPSWPLELPNLDSALIDVVRAAHGRGAHIAGLCLGAFVVAASGVLDGRTAVTHWAAAQDLAEQYPSVRVDAGALYIDHGDVLTSAGTASAVDACLHVVRRHLGAAAASTVARHLVVAPHREGGQAQYIERPIPGTGVAGTIGDTIEWALANLDQALSLDDLAEHACMSRRNFSRRFREVTGCSPGTWVLARRLDQARTLLETTQRSITDVAAACGFRSPVSFRQHFVAAFATTPTSYRQRFTGAH